MPQPPLLTSDSIFFPNFLRTLRCNFVRNSFRKNGPPMAPPAKVLHPKWPHADYLILTFSSKSDKKHWFFTVKPHFFWKNTFSILSRLRPVSLWQCVLPQGSWDPRILGSQNSWDPRPGASFYYDWTLFGNSSWKATPLFVVWFLEWIYQKNDVTSSTR